MILEALSATATDLLTGFLVLLALSLACSAAYIAVVVFGRRAAERRRQQFLRAISQELSTLNSDLPDYLRVTGGARRGPDSPVSKRPS